MQIETYSGKYDDEIISLILDIQNNESKINLSLEEQPDLLTIHDSYQKNGGEFWIALDQGRVIGTLGLMKKDNGIQAVYGPKADVLKSDINDIL